MSEMPVEQPNIASGAGASCPTLFVGIPSSQSNLPSAAVIRFPLAGSMGDKKVRGQSQISKR